MTARSRLEVDPFGIGAALRESKHPTRRWYQNKWFWLVGVGLLVVLGLGIALSITK